jgi:outer membrane protein assembly factor BamB
VRFIAVLVALAGCKSLDNSGDGRGEHALLIDRWLVTHDAVHVQRRSGDRVAVFDVETGARKSVMSRQGPIGCVAAVGARLWCVVKKDMLVLTLPDLFEVGDASELIAAAGLAEPTTTHHIVDGALVVKLIDGRAAKIDPDKLTVEPLPTYLERPRHQSGAAPLCFESPSFRRGAVRWSFGAGSRRAVVRDKIEAATTLLEPLYLHNADETSGPILVAHRREVGSQERDLTALDTEGRALWTIPFGTGGCKHLVRREGALVIATSSLSNRAMSIDAATGAVRWTVGY